jgi:hypothetical protein
MAFAKQAGLAKPKQWNFHQLIDLYIIFSGFQESLEKNKSL